MENSKATTNYFLNLKNLKKFLHVLLRWPSVFINSDLENVII